MNRTTRFSLLPFVILAAVALSCKSDTFGPTNTPLGFITAVAIPGNPILSGTKSWVDSTSKRYYLTDVSNSGVDIVDAVTNAYVGRVPGFVGPTTANNGGTATTNGAGPNSIVFAPTAKAWVSDGNSLVQIVDVNTSAIVASVSTAIPACDDGSPTGHYCGRTNEIEYDPEDKVIFVQNPSPLSKDGAHAALDTYGTFISAVAPYTVLGTITFANAGGQEAPMWVPAIHRLLNAVSGKSTGTAPNLTITSPQYVAVINPKVTPYTIEKQYPIDCQALLGIAALGINDPALGPSNHFIIPGCAKAIVMDVTTGSVVKVVKEIGGGNETWYNPGDNRYYVTGIDSTVTPPVNSLGVIDAATNTFIQASPLSEQPIPSCMARTITSSPWSR